MAVALKHHLMLICIVNRLPHYRNDAHPSGSEGLSNFSWLHNLNPLPQNPCSSLLVPSSHITFIEWVPWAFQWIQVWRTGRGRRADSPLPSRWGLLDSPHGACPGLRIWELPFLSSTTVASQLLLSSISVLLAKPLTMFPAPFVLLSKHWCMHALYLSKQ